jgi:peptidoglycan hydrolase-like protein with peptidoglycan-binding domain
MAKNNLFKHAVIIFTLLGSTPLLSGCDSIYRMLDKEGAQEKELVGEIIPFEVNPTVEEIQNLLKIYGYNVGRPDGVLGARTRNAIVKFQKDNGIEPSRFVDTQTWQKLSVFKMQGFVVDGELSVVKMQEVLLKAGFDVGKADGKRGPRTEKYIKEFQSDHDLKPDGKVGYKTLSAMSLYIEDKNIVEVP